VKLRKDRSRLLKHIGIPTLSIVVAACAANEAPDFTPGTTRPPEDGGTSEGGLTETTVGHGGGGGKGGEGGSSSAGHPGIGGAGGTGVEQASAATGTGAGGLDDDDDDDDDDSDGE
jgi:hypothetical protein